MSNNPVHVTFIHGLSNKPRPSDLRRIWLEALAFPTDKDQGFDLGETGVTDSFVYWAELFYKAPLPASDYESIERNLSQGYENASSTLTEDAWVAALRERFPDAEDTAFDPPVETAPAGFERIPLPGALKRKIMADFLREAHSYLFNVDGIRDTIRQRVIDDLNRPGFSRHFRAG